MITKINYALVRTRALAHYKRMIKWARTQPETDSVNALLMHKAIKETWGAIYCPYCVSYAGVACNLCPLYKLSSSGSHCCGGWWNKMDRAPTWKSWIKYAVKVYSFIDKYGTRQVKPEVEDR